MPSVSLTCSFAINTIQENLKMPETTHTHSWPELAIGLFEHLTGRGAEISYEFEDMKIKVPSGTGAKAEHAEWVLSGGMKIRTKDQSNRPN
jgi:hypothetical protein